MTDEPTQDAQQNLSPEATTAEQIALDKAKREQAELRIRHIRMKAFRALDGTLKSKKFRANVLHRELLSLRPKETSAFFLETLIATAVAGKIKAPKTHSRLVQLKKLQTNAGLVAEYQAFEARLSKSLGGSMFTQHGYDYLSFKELDHADVWSNVSSAIKGLEAKGYEVFLNSGTLLGVIRDKKLIDHDDDVDLAVLLNATTEKDAAIEWRELHKSFVGEARASTPLPIEIHPETGCKIDLFPCWLENGRVYLYPHTSGEMKETDLLPLKKCPTSGQPIPADSNMMLQINYGDNWMIPDPDFQFRWWRAYKKFSTLREDLGITKS